MNAIVALLLALAPAASAMPDQSDQARIMDEIERAVRLPEHAFRLDQYARYYTIDAKGRVVAVYAYPRTWPLGPGDFCELEDEHGIRPIKCRQIPPWPEDGVAGQRKWVADVRALPQMDDGGCGLVSIRWDPQVRKATALCNGYR